MADPVRPSSLAAGQFIKIYRSPRFGRENATIVRVNNSTGILDVRLLSENTRINSIKWRQDGTEGETYWTELPPSWTP